MRHDEGHGTGTVLLSFLLGGAIGAGIALLLAPRSGRETRKKIKELAEDIKEKAEELADDVKDKISSTVHSGKDYLDEKKSVLTAAIEAGREAYSKEKERHAR